MPYYGSIYHSLSYSKSIINLINKELKKLKKKEKRKNMGKNLFLKDSEYESIMERNMTKLFKDDYPLSLYP